MGFEQTDEAWQRQVDEHLPVIYRFLFGLCRNQAEAEDLAQQTFLRARRGGAFAGSERAWLFRIAYREYLNWRRRAVRLVSMPFSVPSVEQGFQLAEAGVDLHRALGKLTPEMRAAFLLIEVDGLTLMEAAEAMGVPEGTVKSRLFRAKESLRKLLDPTKEHEREQRILAR